MSDCFPWLQDRRLAPLLAVLDRDGEEARVVGGAVRDSLLGEPVAEWDIATTALPTVTTDRARKAGWHVVPTGIEHGTVTVVIGKQPFEVTTLREDVETDGRRAVVRFGRDFRADAFRRDFTINALSVSRDGTLHDYADGLADLELRRVRFIGDPDRRIAEDYLRVLRFFRFHARYGDGPLDPAGLSASIRARAGLRRLSRERVQAELKKLLVARRGPEAIITAAEAGLLGILTGGIARLAPLSRLAAVEAEAGLAPDAVRRLGALGLFVKEDAERLVERLRLSNADGKRLAQMAGAIECRLLPKDEAAARILLYRLGVDGYRDAMSLALAQGGEPDVSPLLTLPDRWSPPVSPFGGADAERLGIPRGPAVGRFLAAAERRWIEAGFPTDLATHDVILRQAEDETRNG